ncbi:MAG: hypothetical protein V3S33_02095 [Gammaproteobacteria bacterium]
MPYFVYKIHPGKRLEHMTRFDSFSEARTFAREHRASLKPEADYTVKIIFAEDTEAAEKELTRHREAPILMEHEK